jgi:hypothetical protein
MDKQSALIAAVILTLLLSLNSGVQMVSANPISLPFINVNSPENNKIYSSNQVTLNFTVIDTHRNYTSFSYSLDGQEPIDTNKSGVLTNLPSGSHTLKIYGNATDDAYWNGHELLNIVYFSTIYSTAWLTFALILAVSLATLSLLIFFGRKRIAARLKREKKFSFWLGVLCFLFFTCLVFVPSFWHWANDYLFPRFPVGLQDSPIFGIIISIPFMVIGLLLMLFGTRKNKSRFDSKINQILEKPSAMDL